MHIYCCTPLQDALYNACLLNEQAQIVMAAECLSFGRASRDVLFATYASGCKEKPTVDKVQQHDLVSRVCSISVCAEWRMHRPLPPRMGVRLQATFSLLMTSKHARCVLMR